MDGWMGGCVLIIIDSVCIHEMGMRRTDNNQLVWKSLFKRVGERKSAQIKRFFLMIRCVNLILFDDDCVTSLTELSVQFGHNLYSEYILV